MVRLILASCFMQIAALAPSVGVVQEGNRKITVIGTAHTPSRQQREEVEALIAEKPDAVLVELGRRVRVCMAATGGGLRRRARSRCARGATNRRACGAGRRVPPTAGSRRRGRSSTSSGRRRAARLLVRKPVATGVDVERIDVARALASDPRKALPLLFAASVGAVATAATAQATPHRRAGQRGHRGSGGRRRRRLVDRLGACRGCFIGGARRRALGERAARAARARQPPPKPELGAPPLSVRHGSGRVPPPRGAVLRPKRDAPVPHAPVATECRRAPTHEPVRAALAGPARRRRGSKRRLAPRTRRSPRSTRRTAATCATATASTRTLSWIRAGRAWRTSSASRSRRGLPGRGASAVWLRGVEAVRAEEACRD